MAEVQPEGINHFNTLPDEILEAIFKYLKPSDYLTVLIICKRFRNILNHQNFEQKLVFKFSHCIITEGLPPVTTFSNPTDRVRNLCIKNNIFSDNKAGQKFWSKIGKNVGHVSVSFDTFPGTMGFLPQGIIRHGLPRNFLLNFPQVKTLYIKTINRNFVIPDSVERIIFERSQSLGFPEVLRLKPNLKHVSSQWLDWDAERPNIHVIRPSSELFEFLRELSDSKFKLVDQNSANYLQPSITVDFKDISCLNVKSTASAMRAPIEIWNKFKNLRSLSVFAYNSQHCFFMHQKCNLQSLKTICLRSLNYKGCSLCSQFLRVSCPNLESVTITNCISHAENDDDGLEYIFDTFGDLLKELIISFYYGDFSKLRLKNLNFLPKLETLNIFSIYWEEKTKVSMNFWDWKMPNLKVLRLSHPGFENPRTFKKLVRNTPNLMKFVYKQDDAFGPKFPAELIDVIKKGWPKLEKVDLQGVDMQCRKENCFNTKCALLYRRKVPQIYHKMFDSHCGAFKKK